MALQLHADWSFEAIGTRWWIGIYEPINEIIRIKLQRDVAERIELFDTTYSRFRPDSLVTAMAERAGEYVLPEDAAPMLAMYRQLYDLTNGTITPLIGQSLSDAGYDANYSLQPGTVTPPPAWDDVLHYAAPVLTLSQPALLDFGALGKGYLVDIVCELLQGHGFTGFCVDAGGDMRAEGLSEPLQIGLEHPSDTSMAVGVAQLQSGALCGSAGNRRAWGDYHHILNPHTGQSPQHIQAVWATAPTAMVADAMTTALFFVEPAELVKSFNFSYGIVYANNSMTYTPDFPAELFSEVTHA